VAEFENPAVLRPRGSLLFRCSRILAIQRGGWQYVPAEPGTKLAPIASTNLGHCGHQATPASAIHRPNRNALLPHIVTGHSDALYALKVLSQSANADPARPGELLGAEMLRDERNDVEFGCVSPARCQANIGRARGFRLSRRQCHSLKPSPTSKYQRRESVSHQARSRQGRNTCANPERAWTGYP
jgi:hypothetical protein